MGIGTGGTGIGTEQGCEGGSPHSSHLFLQHFYATKLSVNDPLQSKETGLELLLILIIQVRSRY
ncbi:hypothetical protein SESBI_20133 [Sesbania bispinosa]|nr:hypothetical protein SESBI_20133 [Sesbania bispinosa]